MARFGMAIDKKRCVACNTCCVGCKVENNLPQDMWWNRVVNDGGVNPDSPSGMYPNLEMGAYTMSCQHCDEPACVAVCPAGATFKDDETGIVMQDAEKCIGCGLCKEACPYDVRRLQEGDPAYYSDFAFGGSGIAEHKANTMEKCTFCYHRTTQGGVPFCVEVCPGRARTFGDLDNPNSEISKLIASREYVQYETDAGTKPNLYYLV